MDMNLYNEIVEQKRDSWIPACGNTEVPFNCRGYRIQYLWNPSTNEHSYYNCDTDLLITNKEARDIFGL